ncbi:ABC transporter transmembrane region [Streptococcus urinalis 2285-97]|uniref:ABC transporter transmembrane region n=1 Tax=Streptococcus urinalis 2285-97 TaxID=764291 RepID=G5KFM9_9STRE|nr:ABC transporter transmembrane region [Streptococcus urinalis 2285-97]
MHYLYWASLLAWFQFLSRIICFYIIAQLFNAFVHHQHVNVLKHAILLFGISIIGFIISLFAKNLQGILSQYARDHLKKSFLESFKKKYSSFSSKTNADIYNLVSQGIDSLDTYYSHYLSSSLRTLFNCLTILVIVILIFPLGGIIFLVILPLIPISIKLMQKRSQKIMKHYWQTYMDVGNLFMDDLEGLNTLYSYQVDERYEIEFIKKSRSISKSNNATFSIPITSCRIYGCRYVFRHWVVWFH